MVSACSSTFDPAVKAAHDETKDRSAQAQNSLRQAQNTVPLVAEDTTLRFTQKSIPFVRSSMLPASIGNVTLRVPMLQRHGLKEQDLYDPCVNVLIAAWILSNNFQKLGYTTQGLGAYNAVTPWKRERYARQILQSFKY